MNLEMETPMHQETMCFCSKRLLDINDASYVALVHDMVRPFCQTRCYERFLESQALKAELQRREWAAREVTVTRINGDFEEGFAVEVSGYDAANEME